VELDDVGSGLGVGSSQAAVGGGLSAASRSSESTATSGVGGFRTAGLLGGGIAVLLGAASLAVRRQAAGVRESRRTDLDALMAPVSDVVHGSLARPDGGSVHYVDTAPESDLPTVVLLHGITLEWWMWSAVIRLLRTDHRVIAWDMRGFGASPAGTAGATVEAAAADLAALVDHLDLHRAVVVGHSMGGMVLGRFAADNRDVLTSRIGGLVFLSTSARSLDGTVRTGGLVRLSRTTATLAENGLATAYKWSDTDLSITLLRRGFGHVATAQMVDDLRRCQAAAPAQSMIDGIRSIARHDVLAQLASVTTPTVAVVGELDRLTPVLHARAIASTMPAARLVELPGIGHQSLQEDPHAIAAAVRSLSRR
jgi:pimeloyl-ACP methyl ester carboxylesterase